MGKGVSLSALQGCIHVLSCKGWIHADAVILMAIKHAWHSCDVQAFLQHGGKNGSQMAPLTPSSDRLWTAAFDLQACIFLPGRWPVIAGPDS